MDGRNEPSPFSHGCERKHATKQFRVTAFVFCEQAREQVLELPVAIVEREGCGDSDSGET